MFIGCQEEGLLRKKQQRKHCGRGNHLPDQCLLKDFTFHKCGEKKHIAWVCKNRNKVDYVIGGPKKQFHQLYVYLKNVSQQKDKIKI